MQRIDSVPSILQVIADALCNRDIVFDDDDPQILTFRENRWMQGSRKDVIAECAYQGALGELLILCIRPSRPDFGRKNMLKNSGSGSARVALSKVASCSLVEFVF